MRQIELILLLIPAHVKHQHVFFFTFDEQPELIGRDVVALHHTLGLVQLLVEPILQPKGQASRSRFITRVLEQDTESFAAFDVVVLLIPWPFCDK